MRRRDRTIRAQMRRRDRTIRDHFGNAIEVGDRYFYGSPPTHGIVIKLRTTSLVMDIGACRRTGKNQTMNCKSPEKGICIDRVPEDFWLQTEA